MLVLGAMLGCAEAPRGPVEQLIEKPCAALAVDAVMSTENIYSGIGIIAGCSAAASIIDHPRPSMSTLQAEYMRTCPPLDPAALVPVVAGDRAPSAAIATVTVIPVAIQAVKINLVKAHPYACWLKTGVEASVLHGALAAALAVKQPSSPAIGAALALTAEVLSQEESEDFHSLGNFTRKVRIAVRYSLTQPPASAPLWSEVISTDGGANYGLFARNAVRTRTSEDLLATVARIAYERAIRENIHVLLGHLHSPTLAAQADAADASAQ